MWKHPRIFEPAFVTLEHIMVESESHVKYNPVCNYSSFLHGSRCLHVFLLETIELLKNWFPSYNFFIRIFRHIHVAYFEKSKFNATLRETQTQFYLRSGSIWC
jgi:hypothetical protein